MPGVAQGETLDKAFLVFPPGACDTLVKCVLDGGVDHCRSMTEQSLAEVCVLCGCGISHRAALLGLLVTVLRHMVCSGFSEQRSPRTSFSLALEHVMFAEGPALQL